uniref:Ribosomal protein S7 n=1 Tax=Glaucocystis nostochinearum TaxID=38271 RepID=E9P6E4_9EUKA|nr:ribosomal protein S7 [Glaucocystis nostochinearum]ADW83128.1 ribosomal protein S7 [Glaucocystis nostochinearum]
MIAKVVNNLCKKGKKQLLELYLLKMFNLINKKNQRNSILLFKFALNKIKPIITLKTKRIRGKNIVIPNEINNKKQIKLALIWIQTVLKNKKLLDLETEIINILNNNSEILKIKDKHYKNAESYRAFVHYKW